MGLEDIKGELWIAWCLACDTYDAEKGVPWLAYLRNGMRLHINRYIEKNVTRRHDEVVALSMDWHDQGNADGGDASFGEIIPSDDPGPDRGVEEESQMTYALRKLTPRARQFITFLRDQPEEILAEIRCVQAKADFMKSQGQHVAVSTRLTSAMVFDLMGATRTERAGITNEIKSLGETICKSVHS